MRAVCNVCGHARGFRVGTAVVCNLKFDAGSANLRENLVCEQCGSISRDRMLIWALGKSLGKREPLCSWKEDKTVRILDATGVRAHPAFLENKFDYFNTKYDPEKIREGKDPRRFADFQHLHYPDNYFDCVLASDVLEHIRLNGEAFQEVFRVLRPEGCFLLQVPYVHSKKTEIRVKVEGDRDVFLLPPEYHAERTLVYRIYGRDLLDKLREMGFSVDYIESEIPEHMISRQSIIICTKPRYTMPYPRSQT